MKGCKTKKMYLCVVIAYILIYNLHVEESV